MNTEERSTRAESSTVIDLRSSVAPCVSVSSVPSVPSPPSPPFPPPVTLRLAVDDLSMAIGPPAPECQYQGADNR